VSLRKSFGRIVLFLVLEAGSLLGVPMGPRQVEELMRMLTRTHHEQVLRSEKDDDVTAC